MGSLYKRKVRGANGERKELPTWWLKYYQNGRAVRESSRTTSERVARRMLRVREGDVERGIPVNPKMDRITFEEAAQDLIHDYEANGRESLRVLKQRIAKHLTPFFRGRRMATIRPARHQDVYSGATAVTHRDGVGRGPPRATPREWGDQPRVHHPEADVLPRYPERKAGTAPAHPAPRRGTA